MQVYRYYKWIMIETDRNEEAETLAKLLNAHSLFTGNLQFTAYGEDGDVEFVTLLEEGT